MGCFYYRLVNNMDLALSERYYNTTHEQYHYSK